MRHPAKVERIAGQLRRYRGREPLSLKKRSVSHQVPKAADQKYSDRLVDVADLDDVLWIDPQRRLCQAESGVTFRDLVTATMRYGLVPIIVPELETITIGGAVSGCSLESMSFKYGGFHDTCLEYEVITARGDVLICTPGNENRLLFQMMHGTFGTLGILAKLTFRLVPAKRFVHVTYERHERLADFQAAIWRHFQEQDVDFMDGIIHSPEEHVLCTGRFVDDAPYSTRYDWTKVYYESTRRRAEDYLATRDYYFRYDRGVTNVHPKSFAGRLVFGKLLGSTQLLRLAETFHWLLPAKRPDVTLDVFVPFSRTGAFMDWYAREFQHFPLWCVPYRRTRNYEWLSPRFYDGLLDTLFLDLAIYGMKQRPGTNFYRLMEEELAEIGGVKTLISHNHYSASEFWSIWNKPNYDRVKQLVDPENVFRDLYTKTCQGVPGPAR